MVRHAEGVVVILHGKIDLFRVSAPLTPPQSPKSVDSEDNGDEADAPEEVFLCSLVSGMTLFAREGMLPATHPSRPYLPSVSTSDPCNATRISVECMKAVASEFTSMLFIDHQVALQAVRAVQSLLSGETRSWLGLSISPDIAGTLMESQNDKAEWRRAYVKATREKQKKAAGFVVSALQGGNSKWVKCSIALPHCAQNLHQRSLSTCRNV